MTHVAARIGELTEKIRKRSLESRMRYLEKIERSRSFPARKGLGCANQAHAFAASSPDDKAHLRDGKAPNLAIVTAYNDMLSAHKPYEHYPELIRSAARSLGATAQVAGGTPAMCDGITQGEAGMELSLFSRDVIALSVAIALSHQNFDAAVFLGICDKIVPGLLIGALSFGHLPGLFIPSGPMPSGIANAEKARVRQLYAEGKVSREELLDVEAKSYHGRGTCTFYGTANTNQMLLEFLGLQFPGSSFVPPDTALRHALTREAVARLVAQANGTAESLPMGRVLDERSIVNALVGLCATGGSTNEMLHLIVVAGAAGIRLDLGDFEEASEVTPLLARVYPNGMADVNAFHAAGGVGFVMRELLGAGLGHGDAATAYGATIAESVQEPEAGPDGQIMWVDAASQSGDLNILRPVSEPFGASGGLKVLKGNLGRAVIKTSAVAPERHLVDAPARVFHSQEAMQAAFRVGELNCDAVVVLRFQGPRANGMPELHKLTPALGVLQDKGFAVALLTDGRMSGASGKVPAAIHLTPEAADGGPISKIMDGDRIRLDAVGGTLDVLVPPSEWAARSPVAGDLRASHTGVGRELFGAFRASVSPSDEGASIFRWEGR